MTTTESVVIRIRGGFVTHGAGCPVPDLSGVKIDSDGANGTVRAFCRHCRAAKFEPIQVPSADAPGRYWLGCCKCDNGQWVHSSRARLPFCLYHLAAHLKRRPKKTPEANDFGRSKDDDQ